MISGNVLIEFDAGFDPDQALLDTRERYRAKSDPPDDDEPKVSEVNMFISILWYQ